MGRKRLEDLYIIPYKTPLAQRFQLFVPSPKFQVVKKKKEFGKGYSQQKAQLGRNYIVLVGALHLYKCQASRNIAPH